MAAMNIRKGNYKGYAVPSMAANPEILSAWLDGKELLCHGNSIKKIAFTFQRDVLFFNLSSNYLNHLI